MTNQDKASAISAELYSAEMELLRLQTQGGTKEQIAAAVNRRDRLQNMLIHAQGDVRDEEYVQQQRAEQAEKKARAERMNEEARGRSNEAYAYTQRRQPTPRKPSDQYGDAIRRMLWQPQATRSPFQMRPFGK